MKLSLALLSLLGSLSLCQADTVRLQINGPDGQPVAGAQVRVLEVSSRTKKMQVNDFMSDAKGALSIESENTIAADSRSHNESLMAARIVAPGLAVHVFQLKAGDNTVALAVGHSLEGVALDDSNHPAANTELLISSLPFTALTVRGGRISGSPEILPDDLALRTTTDAQGKWKFESLPQKGTLNIEAKDARFTSEIFPTDVTQKEVTLHLVQGSTIKGRLLKPDGTPAGGIKISAGTTNTQFLTDAEGRFTVVGISGSSVQLRAPSYFQELPFIVNAKEIGGLRPGETRDIGDWKAEEGIKLKGRIVSAATKTPVQDAWISASAHDDSVQTRSDKSGAFEMLVPGKVSGLYVEGEGFISYWSDKIPQAREGAIEMGTLELKAGQKLKGVVVDETGNLVSNVPINAERSQKGQERISTAPTNENGTFTFSALEPDTYTLKSDGIEFNGDTTVRVEIGKESSVRLVIKNSAGQGGQHEINGRIVDSEGTPIAGARLDLLIKRTEHSFNALQVVSEADGSFKSSISGFVIGVSVVNPKVPGYLPAAQKAEVKGSNWNIVLTMQKSGTLRGHVIDAAGKAIQGAFVSTQNGEEQPVATDENGAFSLDNVPVKNVTLFASNGPSLAAFEVKEANVPIEIPLPEVAPIADKVALAAQVLVGAVVEGNWREDWQDKRAILGSERLEQLLIGQPQQARSWNWMLYVQELARHEPQILLERQSKLREQTPPDNRPEFDRLVMLAKANSTDAAQRAEAGVWLRAQQKEKHEVSPQTITHLLGLAQVGARLSPQEGTMWLEYAAQLAEQLDTQTLLENSWQWGPLAARISPEAVQSLSENWSPLAQMGIISNTMQTWLQDENIKAAQKAWATLQKLAPEAEKTPDPEGETKPDEILNASRLLYAQLLAHTDPKGALQTVETLAEYEKGPVLLVIAREAVRQKQFEVAHAAINSLSTLRLGNPDLIARAASIAESFDSALAKILWSQAYNQGQPPNLITENNWYPSLASYARERAAKWPGESRILIEREWAKRIARDTQKQEYDWNSNSYSMKALTEAMAYVNPRRAIEMLEKITETNQLRSGARGNVALAILRSSNEPHA